MCERQKCVFNVLEGYWGDLYQQGEAIKAYNRMQKILKMASFESTHVSSLLYQKLQGTQSKDACVLWNVLMLHVKINCETMSTSCERKQKCRNVQHKDNLATKCSEDEQQMHLCGKGGLESETKCGTANIVSKNIIMKSHGVRWDTKSHLRCILEKQRRHVFLSPLSSNIFKAESWMPLWSFSDGGTKQKTVSI